MDINEFDFQAVDQDGATYDISIGSPDGYSPELRAVGVRPGETRAGWLVFEMPKTTKKAEITWSDASRLDPPADVGTWNFG